MIEFDESNIITNFVFVLVVSTEAQLKLVSQNMSDNHLVISYKLPRSFAQLRLDQASLQQT